MTNDTASTPANAVLNAPFIKGHGTENDFVLFVDPDATLHLDATTVRQIADRRAGLGGDGVIRIARGQALVEQGVLENLPSDSRADEWFMDYRNADGSVAEMCGNGVRVFVHVLVAEGLVDTAAQGSTFGIGTRGGRKEVTVHSADDREAVVSVQMGEPELQGISTAQIGDHSFAGLAVNMGNPHLAAVVPGLDAEALRELPVDQPVMWDEEFFPAGVNLEVVTPLQDGAVSMRVHERGVGETRSCGTGTVAAAVAALADAGQATGTIRVRVRGGEVQVTIEDGVSTLTGPSRIVARGELNL